MYLHIGAERAVHDDEVIAIVDLQQAPAQATSELIELLRVEGRLVEVGGGPTKSCVVTVRSGYLSPISATTLLRRSRHARRYEDSVY